MHGSLADELKRRGRYEHSAVLDILRQVASGLEYAHKKGYVHGTLKPSNIVLNQENNLLVAGFGLLHMLQSSGLVRSNRPYAHLFSIADTLMIAPEYIAPEIVEGKSVDKRSDIYALGAILFELLSGQPPFSGKDPLEVAQWHVKQSAPSLRSVYPDVPVALASVINQALERDPMRRFQGVQELVEAFEQVSGGVTSSFRHTSSRLLAPSETSTQQPGMTGSWQLVPPIVTGAFPVTPSSSTRGSSVRLPAQPSAASPKPQSQPLAASLKLPAIQPQPAPRSRPSPTARTEQQAAVTPVERQAPTARPAQPSIAVPAQQRMQNSDAASMQPFDWWSMAPVPESADRPVEVKPLRVVEPSFPVEAQGQMRLAGTNADMAYGGQPIGSGLRSTSAPRPRSRRSSSRLKRRKILVALLGGGALVAGGVGAIDLLRVMHNAPMNNGNQLGKTNMGGHLGTVVGTTDLAVNSAIPFTNPLDGQVSLLIRLPSGQFVAYERSCTHQGVAVNYDPGTHMLICPLHGSIFDPAQGGQVLQGPAPTALPPVAIHMNADGTITVA
jgi:serine/threonine protein kinase/Rieske Fe-S protein